MPCLRSTLTVSDLLAFSLFPDSRANPSKTHPIYLGPKDLASAASVAKALVDHLAGEHEERWTEICNGLAR